MARYYNNLYCVAINFVFLCASESFQPVLTHTTATLYIYLYLYIVIHSIIILYYNISVHTYDDDDDNNNNHTKWWCPPIKTSTRGPACFLAVFICYCVVCTLFLINKNSITNLKNWIKPQKCAIKTSHRASECSVVFR